MQKPGQKQAVDINDAKHAKRTDRLSMHYLQMALIIAGIAHALDMKGTWENSWLS